MSVDLYVFLRERELPTDEEWQRAIQAAGHDLVFDSFSSREHTGFLPARLAGELSGFEYSFNPIDANEVEKLKAIIADRSHVVTFTLHGNMLELRAAEIAASVLTDLANGVYFDPQSGSHAEGKADYSLLADERNAERERMLAEAERKWAKVTERRCPECNAPCPEYRGSCWVCGFAIGKLPA